MNSNKIDELLSSKINTIKCPCCGYEYLPAEIFLPDYILGKPTDIIRTVSGEIDTVQGLSPQLEETFECVRCNRTFKILAHISFESKTINDVKKSFDEPYVSPLYKDRITLKED